MTTEICGAVNIADHRRTTAQRKHQSAARRTLEQYAFCWHLVRRPRATLTAAVQMMSLVLDQPHIFSHKLSLAPSAPIVQVWHRLNPNLLWQRIASTMLPHSTVVPTPPSFITPNASFVRLSLLLFTGGVSKVGLLCPHADPLTVTGARAALAQVCIHIARPSSASTRILSQ